MNNKIRIENNKTSTLKKEYELDPKKVGLNHITPKPTKKENLQSLYEIINGYLTF